MTPPKSEAERQAIADLKGEQLIEVARRTVDDLEAILDRLESYLHSPSEGSK